MYCVNCAKLRRIKLIDRLSNIAFWLGAVVFAFTGFFADGFHNHLMSQIVWISLFFSSLIRAFIHWILSLPS